MYTKYVRKKKKKKIAITSKYLHAHQIPSFSNNKQELAIVFKPHATENNHGSQRNRIASQPALGNYNHVRFNKLY